MKDEQTAFARQVAAKSARKLRAGRADKHGVWRGIGVSGLIGWSVAVPTIFGALLGLWWDRRHPGAHSWTLALLMAGLVLGCANAWRWVSAEGRAMQDEEQDKDG